MTEQSPAPEAPEPDAPIEPEPSGEVVAFDHDAPSFLQRNRSKWDPGNAAVIRKTVAKGANDAEFAMFLELAAYLGLNPLAKEIWCVKAPGRNGEEGGVLIIVGRDGLLKKAHEWDHPGYGCYRGIQHGVVCENDELHVESTSEGVEVRHVVCPRPTERGKVVGAFARVLREGIFPTFVWCPLEEFMPRSEKKVQYSPWGQQVSTMIEKCAMVRALRLAFSITGVVGEGEADRQLLDPAPATESDDALFGDDGALAGRLRGAMDALDWLPAKRRARLAGLDAEGRAALADELDSLVDTESEGEPADAEVVG